MFTSVKIFHVVLSVVSFPLQRKKFYSTKFEPPKKESKDRKLSDGIRKFLAQKEVEERREKVRKKQEYEELMANRSERDKNKIRKHLKVTKSANKSVLDDAVNKTDTAVTMQGPEQPDEDDYGYTSHEASALYKSLMDKYKTIPEDKKFSKSSLSGCKNADLMSTKDRVRAAILREREEEKLGRKRTHTSSLGDRDNDGASRSSSDLAPKHRSRSNLYDPKAEREAEERKREEERRQKMKARRPPPPVMDFQKLLKLAEEKQHQPIQIEVPQKPKEPERLLTSKEKKEMEAQKREMEERERRKNGLPPLSKSQTNNGSARKADAPPAMAPNGRIPKLNSTNTPVASNKVATAAAVPSRAAPSKAPPKLPSTNNNNGFRKPNTTPFKEPIRPVSSISSSKLATKPHSNGAMRTANSATTSSAMHGKQRPPVDAKTKSQSHDVPRNISKQSKPVDSRNVKAREFPPRDVVKSREFPPRDVVRAREFPPRDLIKSREFPPRDVQRGGHGSMKQKQSVASKRRILDDSDEDEYDSEMDDFIDDGDEELDYSSEIRKMFGYDKSRFRDDDDDCDDMESSFAQQQKEEFISKKAGLMEDLEDMRLEAEEKKRKAAKRRRH